MSSSDIKLNNEQDCRVDYSVHSDSCWWSPAVGLFDGPSTYLAIPFQWASPDLLVLHP